MRLADEMARARSWRANRKEATDLEMETAVAEMSAAIELEKDVSYGWK